MQAYLAFKSSSWACAPCLMTGRPQAVIVHVECGTQALAGAVHNADKGRVPILIFAGSSPFTQEGEMDGSRNEFIQWIQDVHDQRGIVRGYMRYDNEIRTGKNVRQLVERALQFACSDPKGPVYLVGAREVMEEAVEPISAVPLSSPITSPALPENAVAEILADLTGAKRPLVVTSYLGRNPEAVEELVSFCDRHGIAVLESVPNYTNFPTTNPLYQGNHWNHPFQNPVLAEADCILVIDSDVPWIPTVSRPSTGAIIHHIDVDPLKQQMPLWHFPAKGSYRADAMTALRQLNAASGNWPADPEVLAERRNHYGRLHEERNAKLAALEADRNTLTGEVLTAAIRRHIGEDALYVSEGISHYHTIIDHLALSRPGHLFSSGGGSLGYHGGAAIGVKLANPDKLVVALTGDGSYMFSVPSSVHWIAKRYQTPFLTVVYNNRGWKSPRLSALAVHPDGYAQNLQDGIVRARYRRGKDQPAALLEPGRVYEYDIDLWATSNTFLPGHRLRVELASSNFPRFDRNLNTGEDPATGTRLQSARQTIYHSAKYPSHIVLPVIPADSHPTG